MRRTKYAAEEFREAAWRLAQKRVAASQSPTMRLTSASRRASGGMSGPLARSSVSYRFLICSRIMPAAWPAPHRSPPGVRCRSIIARLSSAPGQVQDSCRDIRTCSASRRLEGESPGVEASSIAAQVRALIMGAVHALLRPEKALKLVRQGIAHGFTVNLGTLAVRRILDLALSA
jgi:hypothetical protein